MPSHPLSKPAHHLLTLYRAHLRNDQGTLKRTSDNAHGVARQFLLTLPDHDPAQATTAHCRAFLDGRAPSTAANYGRRVRAFLRWVHDEGHAKVDPKVLRFKIPRAHVGPPRDLALEQVERLLAAAAAVDRRILMGLLLQYCAGARRAEAVGLEVQDCYLGHVDPWILVNGKGRKQRKIPLNADLSEALRSYIGDRTHGPVIESSARPGRPITPGWYSELFQRVRDRAGLPGVTSHQLRHTFATLLRQRGVLLDVLRDLLGHASVQTTERYVSGWSPDLHAAVRRLPAPMPGRLTRDRTRPRNRRPKPTAASQPGVVGYRVRGRARRRR